MQEKNITTNDIASYINMTPDQVSNYLQSGKTVPTHKKVLIAELLQISHTQEGTT
jgi:predicted transcriptional regulator